MRIPSLDGLRAISISMVVASHSALCLSITHPEWFEMRLSSLALSTLNLSGRLGVNVFFVISGFLITTLLLKDGHLGRFYFRRTLRIFPPFYAYLIVVLVLVGFGIISVPTTDLIAGFTYTENYFATKDGWYLLHAWSLAVEEQFYLILPAMMLLTKRPLFPLLAMILCPLIRLYYVSHGGPVIEQGFETVADSLAAGCLLAYHRGFPFAWVAPFVALGITLLLNFPGYYSPSIYVALLIPLQNIALAVTVGWCVDREWKPLNWRPVVYIGTLSYSIYIWQQMFLNPAWNLPLIGKLGLTAAAAVASYYLVEQPALQLRRSISG